MDKTFLCKRNEKEIILCCREIWTRVRHEISLECSRVFVKSNDILLSAWQIFAFTEAKFRFSEISPERKFALAKFRKTKFC